YPALALGVAFAAVLAVPRLRGWLAVPVVAAWGLLHLRPRVGQGPMGDGEIRLLARPAENGSPPGHVLLVINRYAYPARYYGERRTISVELDREAYEDAAFLLPGEIVLAEDVASVVKQYPRWFAITPRADARRLAPLGTVHLVGGSPSYLL